MFVLGEKSLRELQGVHPLIVSVVKRAIELTTQDFSVHDGLRTPEEQRVLVARGASKTLRSKHLRQEDGFGHAVDLVPYVNGKLRWEWPLIYPIASAVHRAAQELRVPLRWGGVWDRELAELSGSPEGLERAVQDYAARFGRGAFLDGPHFELITRT